MASLQQSILAFLKLTRFWNLAIIALAQYLAAVSFFGREKLMDPALFLLSLSTMIIAAAGYIINDYYDIKIDLINKPERVVIGREVARRYALMFHWLLSLLGVGLGFLISWQIGLINMASAFLLWWYSNDLKRQPLVGNLLVALLTGLCVLMVDILFGQFHPTVIIYSIFAGAMTLIREIVKDMEDLKGDNTFGCRTLPIIWGIPRTKVFIYGLMILLVATVFIINQQYHELPLSYFLVFLFAPLVLLFFGLVRADMKKDFYRLSQWCKVIMVLGVASMVFV